MSSAILYLAIVAIWAFLLVPRWLRRSHLVPSDAAGPADIDGQLADLAAGPAGSVTDAEAAAVSVAPAATPHWSATGLLWPGSQESADAPPVKPPPLRPPAVELSSVEPPPARQTWAARNRPPISRAGILQARRRMLTTLVTLAVVTAACRSAGLTPWWTCVPPAGMLGMYLLLLREAALADAESRQRHQEAVRVRTARQRARDAWAAREPEPTAEIIDISGRVGGQLYDQYADATVRAVGD